MASADTICKRKLNWWVGNIPFSHLSRSLRHSSNLCLTIQCFTAVPRFKSTNRAMLHRHREKLDTLEQASYLGMQPLSLFSVLMLLKAWARTLLCTLRRHGKEEVKWRNVTWPQRKKVLIRQSMLSQRWQAVHFHLEGLSMRDGSVEAELRLVVKRGQKQPPDFLLDDENLKLEQFTALWKQWVPLNCSIWVNLTFFFFKSFEWICTERQGLVLPL